MRSRRTPTTTTPPVSQGLSSRGALALSFHQKLPIPHNLLVVHPDVELPPHHINMGRRIPLRPSMSPVGIPKRNMHSRILFILQDLPNHFLQIDVRPNGKLAHSVAVLVGMGVLPEVVFEFAILRVRFCEPVLLHVSGQWSLSQAAKLRAQIVAHHAINDKGPIPFTGSCENFSARQVS